MFRIDNPTAAASLPAPAAAGTPGYFTDGNPGAGQAATILPADWCNMTQEELLAVVADGGLTASKTTYTQLRDAIRILIQKQSSSFLAAAGGTTVYTGTLTPAPAAYVDGMPVRVAFPSTNTGTATLNLNGLGAKTIYQADGTTVVAASGLPLNALLEYRTAANGFVLLTPIQASVTSASTVAAGVVRLATTSEAQAMSSAVIAVTPAGLGAVLPTLVAPGCVTHFASSTPPTGWLTCDGSAVSRTTYANLFAAISTTFGSGDGSTTFNLPDLRGEFIRGFDAGRGVDSGRVFGAAQSADIQAHTHTYGSIVNDGRRDGTQNQVRDTGAGSTTGSTGGSETRPRNIALLPIVKY